MEQHNQAVMIGVGNHAGRAVQRDWHGGFDNRVNLLGNLFTDRAAGCVKAPVLLPDAHRRTLKGDMLAVRRVAVVNGKTGAQNSFFCARAEAFETVLYTSAALWRRR